MVDIMNSQTSSVYRGTRLLSLQTELTFTCDIRGVKTAAFEQASSKQV